jgi:hypothetical protein
MSYEEQAIEEIKEALRYGCGDYMDTQTLDTALSALEKQIPKKLTHEATLYKCFTCPNCKNVVDEFIDFRGEKTRVITPYCKFCGQNLDWGDSVCHREKG